MRNSTVRLSEKRYLHHCSLRSEKNQRTWDKLTTLMKKVCCQLQSFFTRTSTVKPVYEPSSSLSQKRKASRDLQNKQIRILFEKTQRANSCWSQIWDPEARTSSRVWQKKYPGTNWNCWFSANGNWSYYYRVWAIQARSLTSLRRNVRTKSGYSWNLYQELCETWKNCRKVTCQRSRNFLEENWLKTLRQLTSFFQGSNVKIAYNLGDNDAKYPDAEIDDVHTSNSLASPLYLQEREASASLLQAFTHKEKACVQRAQSIFSKYGETRYLDVTKSANLTKSWTTVRSGSFLAREKEHLLAVAKFEMLRHECRADLAEIIFVTWRDKLILKQWKLGILEQGMKSPDENKL